MWLICLFLLQKNGKKNPYKLLDFHVFQNHSENFRHVVKIFQKKEKEKKTVPRTG